MDRERFDYYLRRQTFEIIGVEPDIAVQERLLKSGYYKNVFPIALYDEDGSCKLYITKSNDCSSILKPNQAVIKSIIDSEWWPKFEVVDTKIIETKRLDTFCQEYDLNFDLIKVDVQGVEYEIVNSGLNIVENAIGILAELNTVPWYVNQKTYKEFARLVNEKGFVEVERNHKSHIPTESDYLFVKKFNRINDKEDLIKVLLLLFTFYKNKLFLKYTFKGFFTGLLSLSDLRNIFFIKKRKFFLVK